MPAPLGIVASGVASAMPLSLSPSMWFDASDTSSISDSGGSVSAWNDKSGNGNHLESFGGAFNPTTGATTLNGLNVIDFDGGDVLYDSLSGAAPWKFFHDGTKHIIGAVVKWTSTNGGLFGTIDGSTGAGFYIYKSGTQLWHAVQTSAGGDVVLNQSASSTVGTSTAHVIGVLADPGNGTASNRSELRVDATSGIQNNSASGTPNSGNPTWRPRFGALPTTGDSTTLYMTGYIAEIVVVSGATNATSANLTDLMSYLKTKWGL